jgi:hypothetical protein
MRSSMDDPAEAVASAASTSTSGDALKTTMTRADALVMGWAVRDSNP